MDIHVDKTTLSTNFISLEAFFNEMVIRSLTWGMQSTLKSKFVWVGDHILVILVPQSKIVYRLHHNGHKAEDLII